MTEIADRYRNAATRFGVLVDAVPADAWSNPSPCADWTAEGVLDHVVTTELDFLRQRELPMPDIEGHTTLESWPTVRDAVQAVLDDPTQAKISYDGYFGRTTVEETLDAFYGLDLLVHRWDLAKAVGLEDFAELTDDERAIVSLHMANIPDDVMRTPGLFGPAIEPATDADPTTKLMNFLGRTT